MRHAVETQRLLLKPLTYDQLLKYIRNDHSLEAELHLKPTERSLSPELREALEETILPNVLTAPVKHRLFSTLWTLVLKNERQMVGDLCFVGPPNEQGEIEIGYGTYEQFQGQGFMTEAVGGMLEWARRQPSVRAVVAATEQANAASFAVLQKNGFVKTGATETLFQWRFTFD